MARARVSKSEPQLPDEVGEVMRLLADQAQPGEFATDALRRIIRERDSYATKVKGRFVE